jgi:hypothetical protein
MEENMNDLFAFKQKVVPGLKDNRYIDGDIPAVSARYPSAGKALIWNVEEERHTYQIKRHDKILQTVSVSGLDVEMLYDN